LSDEIADWTRAGFISALSHPSPTGGFSAMQRPPACYETVSRDRLPRATRGLSCDDVDGVTAVRHRVDAVAAARSRRRHRRDRVLSDTPRRPRRGPKQLKIEKETTHDLV